MFGRTGRKLKDLERRVAALETVQTWEYGEIPASQLWRHIAKLIAEKIRKEREKGEPK